jgi:hypothetical protein
VTQALVVPVALDALAVNQHVAGRDGFRTWQFGYGMASTFKSPEPEGFAGSAGTTPPGVYLHWVLPAALRHGTQDERTGEVAYPLVPNRWLVRRSGPKDAAWVVESDCPHSGMLGKALGVQAGSTSLYPVTADVVAGWTSSADRYRNAGADVVSDQGVVRIGIAFPFGGWQERSATPSFLTAAGPGNPLFSTYVPHNRGVLSLHDDLAGAGAGTYTYSVVGWYSDPAADVLAGATSPEAFAALLADLGWVAPEGTEPVARSLYEGAAFGVAWDPAAPGPAPDPLVDAAQSGALDVAIGNTTGDAFASLVGVRLAAKGYDAAVVPLLRAFVHDVLPLANEPNGDALVRRAIERTWFGARPGGTAWTLVPDGSEAAAALDAAALAPDWLARLNADQARLDALSGEIADLRWRFHALWWKSGALANATHVPAGAPAPEEVAAQLDPGNPASLAATLVERLAEAVALVPSVPGPDWTHATSAAQALADGVAAFATARGAPAGAVLKAVPLRPYSVPNDPVLVLSGVAPPAESTPVDGLPVRTSDAFVTSVTAGGTTTTASSVGTLSGAGLPADLAGAITAALAELALLATGVGAGGTATYDRPAPALDLVPWRQPWQPMLMEWAVRYAYVPYVSPAEGPWRFDGTDYVLDSSATAADTRVVTGISLLSPHAQLVFQQRLHAFVADYGAQEPALATLDTEIGRWPFLAQELTGFGELLTVRDPRAFRRPMPDETVGTGATEHSAAALAGYPDATGPLTLPPQYGPHPESVPYVPNPPQPAFHGVRQGQVYVSALTLYDKFGRALQVVADANALAKGAAFPLVVDPALAPTATVFRDVVAPAQLPPRVLQGARLAFDLMDGRTGTEPAGIAAPGVNPVGGWVLPNHLDRSLLLYAPGGQSLGEYRLTARADGTRAGTWQPPPHSDVASLGDVARLAPLVAAFAGSAALAGEAAFDAFLDAVDATLWTVDPPGARGDRNLSVLIGRPLALVRARLAFELEGPALRDCSWPATLNPPEPELTGLSFPVRLGDQATRDDGLVGYFAGSDYDVFHAVAAPRAEQGYVTRIGPPGPGGGDYVAVSFAPGAASMVTMLLDPRAGVHATTGLLPVVRAEVPREWVGPALSALEATFRVAPALVSYGPSQGDAPPHPDAVAYPVPAERAGTWSWWEPGPAGWTGYTVADASTHASDAPSVLSDGLLQLVTDLGSDA